MKTIIVKKNGNEKVNGQNGRKVFYPTGKPGELKGAGPGDTVVQDGKVQVVGYDGRLWFVKFEG